MSALSKQDLIDAAVASGMPPARAVGLACRLSKALDEGRYTPRPLQPFVDEVTGRAGLRPHPIDAIVLAALLRQFKREVNGSLSPDKPGGAMHSVPLGSLLRTLTTALQCAGVTALHCDFADLFESIRWPVALDAADAAGASCETLDVLCLFAAAWPDGLPLGLSTSPLLAALVLRDLDCALTAHVLAHVRWVNDGVVVTREPDVVEGILRRAADELGLSLHPVKTQTYRAPECVPWVGLELGFDGTTSPSAAALERRAAALRAQLAEMPGEDRAGHVGRVLAHWRQHCNSGLHRLDDFERLVLNSGDAKAGGSNDR